MQAALANDTWIADLAHGNTEPLWLEVLRLRRWLNSRNIQLTANVRDTIIWKHEASGTYSTSSAYNCQFQGAFKSRFRKLFWHAWAPGRQTEDLRMAPSQK